MTQYKTELFRLDSDGQRVDDYKNPKPKNYEAKTSQIASALAVQDAEHDALWDVEVTPVG